MKKIAMASDHAGFPLKSLLRDFLEKEKQYQVVDLGTNSESSVDYPVFARKLAEVVAKENIFGIAICGSGIGITMAAGKTPGVRAANCTNTTMAKLSRQHNNANVLGLGARLIGTDLAKDITLAFLETQFEGGRHSKRVEQIG